jgi:hypothetical protein
MTKKLITRRFLDQLAGQGNSSEQPIFVLGMPRSGSTLVEQILTSHPEVVTAGEIPAFPRIVEKVCAEESERDRLPERYLDLTPQKLGRIASEYLAAISQYGENAGRIVDKLPGNVFYVGLIRLAFPRARIINTVRHPLDTCLSCFFQPFRDVRWSYDLSWIGQFYRNSEDLVAHWRSLLPADDMLDMHYERLVEDTETEAKRLINHCGLEWDDRCLDFHRAKRSVGTASLWQVRQPVYKSSKQRWLNYAPYIGDLVQALGPCGEPYYDELEAHGGQAPRSYRKLASRLLGWGKPTRR